jgi:hypothetical protein
VAHQGKGAPPTNRELIDLRPRNKLGPKGIENPDALRQYVDASPSRPKKAECPRREANGDISHALRTRHIGIIKWLLPPRS